MEKLNKVCCVIIICLCLLILAAVFFRPHLEKIESEEFRTIGAYDYIFTNVERSKILCRDASVYEYPEGIGGITIMTRKNGKCYILENRQKTVLKWG